MKLNWPQDLDESRFLAEYWQQKPLWEQSVVQVIPRQAATVANGKLRHNTPQG